MKHNLHILDDDRINMTSIGSSLLVSDDLLSGPKMGAEVSVTTIMFTSSKQVKEMQKHLRDILKEVKRTEKALRNL